jgi:hypothetical protein
MLTAFNLPIRQNKQKNITKLMQLMNQDASGANVNAVYSSTRPRTPSFVIKIKIMSLTTPKLKNGNRMGRKAKLQRRQ